MKMILPRDPLTNPLQMPASKQLVLDVVVVVVDWVRRAESIEKKEMLCFSWFKWRHSAT